MESTHLFELEAWNAPSILPRIALVLSRRRLTPERMHFTVADDPRFCTFEFSVRCDRRTAERLHAQLAKVMELIDVSMRSAAPMLASAPETGAGGVAAASVG